MSIEIDGNKYDVEIIRKNNKNTYIRVKNGKIIVSTNRFSTRNSIIKIINDNKDSIIKMIEHDKKRMEKEDRFYYFGKSYDIVYGFSEIDIRDNKIYCKNEKDLEKYINKEIYNIFKERLDYWYNIYEEDIPRPNLKIRKMKSRWGVCNIRSKNITLNYQLIKYDIECLDYVIVHELAHLIHPNHSRSFWLLVEKYYPRYKECRKKLKD